MSVISEGRSSQRRYGQKSLQNRSGRPGEISSRSVAGIDHHDHQSYLLPQFSAASSEGIKSTWVKTNGATTLQCSQPTKASTPTADCLRARRCSRLCWISFAFLVSLISLLSAPLMSSAPYLISVLDLYPDYVWPAMSCEIDCQASYNMNRLFPNDLTDSSGDEDQVGDLMIWYKPVKFKARSKQKSIRLSQSTDMKKQSI
uniref:Uncharacterized protein n=1 Tax=Ditylenchus dipsaci TaxID=166011 RepID=A0A915ESC5_9BILA